MSLACVHLAPIAVIVMKYFCFLPTSQTCYYSKLVYWFTKRPLNQEIMHPLDITTSM